MFEKYFVKTKEHIHCPLCLKGILEHKITEFFDDCPNKYLFQCLKCTTIFVKEGWEFKKLFNIKEK